MSEHPDRETPDPSPTIDPAAGPAPSDASPHAAAGPGPVDGSNAVGGGPAADGADVPDGAGTTDTAGAGTADTDATDDADMADKAAAGGADTADKAATDEAGRAGETDAVGADPVGGTDSAGAAGSAGEAGQADGTPVAGTEPAGPGPSVEPEAGAAVKPRRRRRIGLIAGCAVLFAALVGGTGFTVVTVRDADRDPGDPVWRLPAKASSEEKQPEDAGLKGMLLPFGASGYGRGPDLGQYGADAELSGAQATALRKESLRNLPRSQRRLMEKQIDKQHITGMAMRSYLSVEDPVNQDTDDAFVMEIVLSRMENRGAVRSLTAVQQEFLSALDVFRAGPRIEGHKNARCFLPPKDSKEKLEYLFCSGYVGDVLVSATGYGLKPMDTKEAARFLRDQLDRIKDPGKAV
ncbi:hypothetical protein ACFZB5_16405 [Streptomyces nodosus]|uniref:hypothetical protein n=1 Tax=Streptomyces nodosus TaxID=40318 RepID=UPI0036EEA652